MRSVWKVPHPEEECFNTSEHGTRRKSRSKFRKSIRQKGKISLTRYFQTFKINERVILKAEPSIQKAMYHQRFHGRTGLIKGMRGKCYEVLIKDGGKEKTLIVHPVHLKKG